MLWTTKYQPYRLSDLQGPTSTLKRLAFFVQHWRQIPNLLFFGKPGQGKTSASYVLIREIVLQHLKETQSLKFKPEESKHALETPSSLSSSQSSSSSSNDSKLLKIADIVAKSATKRLDASVQTGIDTMRTDVDLFTTESSVEASAYRFPLKFIVLDECDMLSSIAQGALRRLMEQHGTQVRFILICNNPSKLMWPVISRTSRLLFQFDCDGQLLAQFLMKVLVNENIRYDTQISAQQFIETTLIPFVQHTKSDVRNCLTILNNIQLKQLVDPNLVMNERSIWFELGFPPPVDVEQWFREQMEQIAEVQKNGINNTNDTDNDNPSAVDLTRISIDSLSRSAFEQLWQYLIQNNLCLQCWIEIAFRHVLVQSKPEFLTLPLLEISASMSQTLLALEVGCNTRLWTNRLVVDLIKSMMDEKLN